MKTASRTWLPGTFGALVGIAIVAAFGSGMVPVQSGTILQAGASLGRAVAEFTAIGFALGFAAFGLRRLAAHVIEARHLAVRAAATTRQTMMPVNVVTIPRLVDATASEFDDGARPAFAPVTSLTEAQVERDRARRLGYSSASGHSARLR